MHIIWMWCPIRFNTLCSWGNRERMETGKGFNITFILWVEELGENTTNFCWGKCVTAYTWPSAGHKWKYAFSPSVGGVFSVNTCVCMMTKNISKLQHSQQKERKINRLEMKYSLERRGRVVVGWIELNNSIKLRWSLLIHSSVPSEEGGEECINPRQTMLLTCFLFDGVL